MTYSDNHTPTIRTSLFAAVSFFGLAVGIMPATVLAQSHESVQSTATVETQSKVTSTQSKAVSPFAITQTSAAGTVKDAFEIEVRADSLVLEPVIATGIMDSLQTAVRGSNVNFLSYNNYAAFVARSEIRILASGQSPDAVPLAVLNVDKNGMASWKAPLDGEDSLFYIYRIYDAKGRFDETKPHALNLLREPTRTRDDVSRPLFGSVDESARRTIPVESTGVSITVSGKADPLTDIVYVAGQLIPVDDNGHFTARQLLPREKTSVPIKITRGGAIALDTDRKFELAPRDWFLVGQGELTLGAISRNAADDPARGDSLAQGDFLAGRAAFYAKGIVGKDVKLTAALDTGEALVSDLFRNIDRKDPRQLLRRINSTQYYPTYGDDSTLVEDTPSQGRFYLRAQKDASQLVIGNFATAINSTELAQLDRGLFGALLDLNGNDTTSFGERKTQVTAFASQPGTVPGRDEFRGTGGSLYFLKRQDLSVGSERIRVEIRDLTTGLVLETRDLRPQEDYDFDPYQGRLTLLKPLASFAGVGNTVRNSSTPGNIPVLVVRYEYTPTLTSLSGYIVGGRATQWLSEQVRLGVSVQRDATQEVDQTLLGTDVLLRYAAGTYVKAEVAQTKGPSFGQSNSVDGGFGFTDFVSPLALTAGSSRTARAWRAEAAINFAELTGQSGDLGKASGYYERTGAGFSAVGRLTQSDTERYGAAVSVPLGRSTQIAAKFDQISIAAGGVGTVIGTGQGRSRAATADIVQNIGENVTAKLGLRYEARNNSTLGNGKNGNRTDGAVQLDYAPRGANFSVSGFGQLTLDRDVSRTSNNRAGVGAKAQLTDRLSLNGEVSGGSGGLGADVKLNHRVGEGSEAYIGYAVLADRSNTGFAPQNLFNTANGGTLTVGARQRYSDALSVNGEQRLVLGGSAPSLVRAFGLTYEPDRHFSVSGSFETGRVEDALTGLFRRTAATASIGYTEEDVRVGSSVEARFENNGANRLNVWLFRNTLDYRVNPDWRFLGRLNFAVADGNQPSVRAADFVEGVAGFAYRPVDNERLNVLARVTYLQDLGPVGQISGSGTTQNPKQISSIVSIDLNYDITPKLTLGAKYGYREGRVSISRGSDNFVSSTAHLGVLRLDYRVAKKWDALVEGRVLAIGAANDKRFGALGAIYRHLGAHVKIGAGYSFSSFSDDLTDQSNSSRGPFINLIGKF